MDNGVMVRVPVFTTADGREWPNMDMAVQHSYKLQRDRHLRDHDSDIERFGKCSTCGSGDKLEPHPLDDSGDWETVSPHYE